MLFRLKLLAKCWHWHDMKGNTIRMNFAWANKPGTKTLFILNVFTKTIVINLLQAKREFQRSRICLRTDDPYWCLVTHYQSSARSSVHKSKKILFVCHESWYLISVYSHQGLESASILSKWTSIKSIYN